MAFTSRSIFVESDDEIRIGYDGKHVRVGADPHDAYIFFKSTSEIKKFAVQILRLAILREKNKKELSLRATESGDIEAALPVIPPVSSQSQKVG
jgi:hypothetical protein